MNVIIVTAWKYETSEKECSLSLYALWLEYIFLYYWNFHFEAYVIGKSVMHINNFPLQLILYIVD